MRIHRSGLTLMLVLAAAALVPRMAAACGGRPGAPPAAFPAAGATEVSRYTSIIYVSGISGIPAGLSLEANGTAVPLPGVFVDLGEGLAREGGAHFWRLTGGLEPSTSYVLRAPDNNGHPHELTHFTTAASYDKTPGTPPRLDRLRLWRVRYDVSQVQAGGCVFSEYEGYIDLDYQPGAVPATPPEEVVQVLSLSPRTGGQTQTFVFAGAGKFEGALVEAPGGNGLVDVPEGSRPSPVYAAWKPELAPDREYCATLTLYGRNDQAALAPISTPICAPVTNIDARTTGATAGGASGGSGAGGNGGMPGAAAGNGGASAGSGGSSAGAPSGPQPATGGGCSLGGGSSATAPTLALLLVAFAAIGRRRPRW